MIFARNSDKEILVPRADGGMEKLKDQIAPHVDMRSSQGLLPPRNIVAESYEFKEVEIISEEQAYQHYRTKKMQRLQMHRERLRTEANTIDTRYAGVTPNASPPPFKVGLVDIYIIPKLFNYFPFLDCDSQEEYEDCCSHLESDGVRFVSYQSSNRGYWIFCDKAMDFDNTISFIKQYPADGRYSWIAEYKREFCVRAIPKKGIIPERIVADDSDLSREFKFWLECFDQYWATSKLIEYIMIDEVGDNI